MTRKRFDIDLETLVDMYWGKGLSLLEIGNRLGCASRTIDIRMHELNVPLRPSGIPGPEISKKTLRRLYINTGLSSRKIAKMYKCAYSTIDRKIRGYGFPIKTLAAAHITSKRRPFDGTLEDKAYLIGFRTGDLRVRKMYKRSETLLIDCASTHQAQIDLISSLFKKYGRIWTSLPTKSGKVQVECGVDLSFSFLLPKLSKFPQWTFRTNPLFLSVLAGFVDAEGCFYVNKNRKIAGFSIGNYNTQILKQVELKLTRFGFHPRLFMGVKKGYTGKDGYSHREDYWILSLYRKIDALDFSSKILPYLKHREKIDDARNVIRNIKLRNKLYGE